MFAENNFRFRKRDLSLQPGVRAADGQRARNFLHIFVLWDLHNILFDDDRPDR